jgi:hypothetical protein
MHVYVIYELVLVIILASIMMMYTTHLLVEYAYERLVIKIKIP